MEKDLYQFLTWIIDFKAKNALVFTAYSGETYDKKNSKGEKEDK